MGVIATLFKWKKPILYICGITALGATLIAFIFLDNYYKSTTIFNVASPDLFKPEQIFGTSQKDMDYFGTDLDVDRILTIAQSNELIDFLVDSFKLYQHYEIDSTQTKAPYKVRDHFEKLYNVEKNKYNAIELSVEDKDKKFAAAVAKAARDRIDDIASNLIKSSQSKLIQTYNQSISEKETHLKLLSDTLTKLRLAYGIYDLKTQSELMTTLVSTAESNLARSRAKLQELERTPGIPKDTLTYIRANIKGYEEELKSLTSPDSKSNFNLTKFNDGKDVVDLLDEMHTQESASLGLDKQRFTQMKVAYGSKISAIHLMEDAAVPIVKSCPFRSLIILTATLIAFIFSVIGVLLLESYKDVDWKEIVKGNPS